MCRIWPVEVSRWRPQVGAGGLNLVVVGNGELYLVPKSGGRWARLVRWAQLGRLGGLSRHPPTTSLVGSQVWATTSFKCTVSNVAKMSQITPT